MLVSPPMKKIIYLTVIFSLFVGWQTFAAATAESIYESARLKQDAANIKEAIHIYNQLLKEYPQSPLADDALYQIGLLRRDPLKENEKARRAFETLLERYPNGDMAEKAKEQLAEGKPREAKKPNKVVKLPANDPFASSILESFTVDMKETKTNITFLFNEEKPYTKEFTEVGLRTKSPAKLTLHFPMTKVGDKVAKGEDISSPHLKKVKLRNSFLSGDLVASFELENATLYKVNQEGKKVVVSFYKKGDESAAKPVALPSSTDTNTRDIRVVIDPGHGGEDEGAVGPNGVKEKDITLAISKKLAVSLGKKIGAKVFLTREKDTTLTLEERNNFANSKKADLFISVHANAVKDHSVSGIETYYLNNATDEAAKRLANRENQASSKPQDEVDKILLTLFQNYNTEQSSLLAGAVHEKMISRLSKRYPKLVDRKLKSALFYVLVGAKCPGILVETSYVSNPLEEKRLTNSAYQKRLADSVAEGVEVYIKKNPDYFISL